jgi:hypothetical protein
MKEDEMHWTCNTHVRMRNTYRILIRKTEEKRQLGRYWHTWEDNIKMNVEEIRCEILGWM